MSHRAKETGKNRKFSNGMPEAFGFGEMPLFGGNMVQMLDLLEFVYIVEKKIIGKIAFLEWPSQPGEINPLDAYLTCATLYRLPYILVDAAKMHSIKEVEAEILRQAGELYGSDKVTATEGKTDIAKSRGIFFLDLLHRLELLGDRKLLLLIDGGEHLRKFDEEAGQKRMSDDDLNRLDFTMAVVTHTPKFTRAFLPKLDDVMWVSGRQDIFEKAFAKRLTS
jgi:hypothetical protein